MYQETWTEDRRVSSSCAASSRPEGDHLCEQNLRNCTEGHEEARLNFYELDTYINICVYDVYLPLSLKLRSEVVIAMHLRRNFITMRILADRIMDKEWMPKVDLKKDRAKIKNIHISLMNEVEKQNSERVKQLMKLRRSNRILGSILGVTVLSIYFYTIYTVKQEKFLDDFNEPEKIIISPQTNV
ncbi:hypothetical protein V1477_016049 [Vespula maculifrons]|uniref:Cytochrome c oxidase assembly factor 3 n=1 Tax=Vespula maculifrons TaxID=7453 RepID=A0ABD2BBX6_VESMC